MEATQLSDLKLQLPLNNSYSANNQHRCDSTTPSRKSVGFAEPHPPSLGIMGGGELIARITLFFLDVFTDVFLLYSLWNQSLSNKPYFWLKHKEEYNRATRFQVTLAVVCIPTIFNNILSLVWYFKVRNYQGLRGSSIMSKDGLCRKMVCVILHILALGQIMRYIDIFRHRKRIHTYVNQWITNDGQDCPPRTTYKGEISLAVHKVLSKDTVILDTTRAVLQDCPQILLQIYILYRSRIVLTTDEYIFNKHWNVGSSVQIIKIIISILFATISLVEFQFMSTRDENEKFKSMSKLVCLLRRFAFIAARLIAIGSFAALHVHREGGLVKAYTDLPKGFILSFPTITFLIIAGHWCIMVIWIYSQNTKFCSTENGTPRPIREFFFDLFVAWIHVFDYINLKYSPTRRRILFYYILIFVENTALITVLFLQLISIQLWIRVCLIFVTESLFLIGLSCLIVYYAFQHDYNDTRHSSIKYNPDLLQ